MKNIFVIAENTFREKIRDRILYAILGFAVLYILLDLFLAKLSLGDLLMIRSFGLAGIYIFGLIITIFLGSSLIYDEIERRTLYFVLSKPVSRRDVIWGKFIGLLGATALTTFLMALVYLGVVAYEGGGFDLLGLFAVFFQILEQGLFIALLIFFSSLATPLTSTLSATMILFVGHLLDAALVNASEIGGVIYRAVFVASYLLPNLEKFNLRNLVAHDLFVSSVTGFLALGYALAYMALLLFAATIIFNRREL